MSCRACSNARTAAGGPLTAPFRPSVATVMLPNRPTARTRTSAAVATGSATGVKR